MGFLFSVISATIFVSALSGQHLLAEARIDTYPQWKGIFQPLIPDWNDDKYSWNSRDDPYLYENSIDDSGYRGKEYNDDPDIRYYIINHTVKREPTPPTLADLLRYNDLSAILAGTARMPENSDFSQSGQPMRPPLNEMTKPNNEPANLIPSSMISSRPFRLATLASIGYGPNFRFYR